MLNLRSRLAFLTVALTVAPAFLAGCSGDGGAPISDFAGDYAGMVSVPSPSGEGEPTVSELTVHISRDGRVNGTIIVEEPADGRTRQTFSGRLRNDGHFIGNEVVTSASGVRTPAALGGTFHRNPGGSLVGDITIVRRDERNVTEEIELTPNDSMSPGALEKK